MNRQTISLHPNFPQQVWVVIEQPRHAPYRFDYDPATNTFIETTYKSLFYDRGFSGAYGWIGGTGTPPGPHFDVMLLTNQTVRPGDVVMGYLCGVFVRGDGDHKFIALDRERRQAVAQADLAALADDPMAKLRRLYPLIGENEGWFSAEVAQHYLQQRQPTHQ